MLIENKKVFLYHKDRNSMKFSFYDTEKLIKKDIEITPDNCSLFIQTIRDQNKVFCGYGNSVYEDIVVNELISKSELFTLMSTRLLHEHFVQRDESFSAEWTDELKQLKKLNLFYHFDLSVLLFPVSSRPSLNDIKYTLCPNVNIPDIDVIVNIFDLNKDFINARLEIENKFDIDLINRPSVDIGLDIARKYYCKQNNLQWKDLSYLGLDTNVGKIKLSECIDLDKYNLDNYQTIKEYLQKEVFIPGYNTIEKDFVFQDMKCKFSMGGIKAFRNKGMYCSTDTEQILYIDARSFYPSIFVNHRIYPSHLNESIVNIMRDMMTYRFESKNPLVVKQMKSAMNALIGKMMIEGWLYDPFQHTKLVLTGNLILLELMNDIDKNNGQIIQINNDGMFIKLNIVDNIRIKHAIDEIGIKHNIYFKIIDIDKLLLYSPSSYVYTNSNQPEICSGLFDTKSVNYGKLIPANVIADTAKMCLLYDVPIETYIKSCKNMLDFCEFYKAQVGYVLYNGKIFNLARVYYSTRGLNVFKAKVELNKIHTSQKINKNQTGVSGYNVAIGMQDDIDYQYYIKEAQKIVNEITQKQLTLF